MSGKIWSLGQVGDWLSETFSRNNIPTYGLGKFVQDNDLDLEALLELTEAHLECYFGICALGKRLRVLMAIKELKNQLALGTTTVSAIQPYPSLPTVASTLTNPQNHFQSNRNFSGSASKQTSMNVFSNSNATKVFVNVSSPKTQNYSDLDFTISTSPISSENHVVVNHETRSNCEEFSQSVNLFNPREKIPNSDLSYVSQFNVGNSAHVKEKVLSRRECRMKKKHLKQLRG